MSEQPETLEIAEALEWGAVSRAGRWLKEAGRNADHGLTTYRVYDGSRGRGRVTLSHR